MKKLGIALVVVALFLILDFSSVLWSGIIWSKQEEIRRDIFVNSQSYNDGIIRDLADYKHQWDNADMDGRISIEAVVRHSFSNYDMNEVPEGLRPWLSNIRGF